MHGPIQVPLLKPLLSMRNCAAISDDDLSAMPSPFPLEAHQAKHEGSLQSTIDAGPIIAFPHHRLEAVRVLNIRILRSWTLEEIFKTLDPIHTHPGDTDSWMYGMQKLSSKYTLIKPTSIDVIRW